MEFRYQVIVSVANLRKSFAKFMVHVQITLLKKVRIISLLQEWKSATWLSFVKSNCEVVTFPSVSDGQFGKFYIFKLLSENCLRFHSCHFVKTIFFGPKSFMHMFNVSPL